MDRWKFYDISHRDHTIMNPTSLAKGDELAGLLDLADGAKVLDVGSGKGEMLCRMATRVPIDGFGVDRSPYAIEEAKRRAGADPAWGRAICGGGRPDILRDGFTRAL